METATTFVGGPQVNIGRWISEGWELINKDLGFYVVLTLVWAIIVVVSGSTVLGLVLAAPVHVGYYYIFIQKLRNKPVTIGDLGRGFDVFVAAVLMFIVVGIFEAIGFLFCILPGFIVTAWYLFAPALVIDKRMDFWQAMEVSRMLVQKHLFDFVLFVVVQFLLLLLGLVLCCVGIFVMVPVCTAATVCAYRDMFEIVEENATVS